MHRFCTHGSELLQSVDLRKGLSNHPPAYAQELLLHQAITHVSEAESPFPL